MIKFAKNFNKVFTNLNHSSLLLNNNNLYKNVKYYSSSNNNNITSNSTNNINNSNTTSDNGNTVNKDLPIQPVMPTNCCGNGCANCVWDGYFNELEEYNLKMKELNPNLPEEPLMTSDENEDPMQFFMKMERYFALQKKKQEQEQKKKQEQQNEQLVKDVSHSIASS